VPTRLDANPNTFLRLHDSEASRSEMRQFLFALSCLAFVLAALGTGNLGTNAFAADIVLVFCGAWCANQLIRGKGVFQQQVICVLQAYFVGILCCSTLLFAVGWLVFLPSEFVNLGHSLLLAATFTTNLGLVFFPVDSGLRLDGLLDHLWLPALIAQCCAILAFLHWQFHRNPARLLLALCVLATGSLFLSLTARPDIRLLPLGGLWAFLCGAIPFIATNRFPILKYAFALGVINLTAGILAIATTGDTLFARTVVALGIALLYLGSRPRKVDHAKTAMRRRWFGMMLHTFLWAVPLTKLHAGLSFFEPNQSDLLILVIPCLVFAIFSWMVWQHVERRFGLERMVISGVLAAVLFANGLTVLTSHGLHLRFPQSAHAYINALQADEMKLSCPIEAEGALAGLEVCRVGPPGPPAALIWGDHQLAALRPGFAEAARRADVPTLVISQPNCIPSSGLQSRFADAAAQVGRDCDQHAAQVLQAIPHLSSLRQVTLVADWLYYTNDQSAELLPRAPVRLGPDDGSPIDIAKQAEYASTAAEQTIAELLDQNLRVSVVRQVPAQPGFDAEVAARASAPGAWLYFRMPPLSESVSLDVAKKRMEPVDSAFNRLAAQGRVTYVNTWPAFCSDTRCDARGGLSSDYLTSTQVTPTGALSLAQVFESDLRRVTTHAPVRRALEG
jgi:hypothetical protein